MQRVRTTVAWGAIVLAWIGAVTIGMRVLLAYEYTPGPAATAPEAWPQSARVPAPRLRPALVLLMHPQCSCSRATVGELARLMAHVHGRVDAYVLMLDPFGGRNDTWAQSDLWTAASAIPGVRVMLDRDGADARRFGASTSGQALLYDVAGRLRFNGGITDARGHEGDNAGRASLESIVLDGNAATGRTSVFGCGLFAS